MKKIIVLMALFASLCVNAESVKKPLVFYMKNLPQERIGEWTDEQIKTALEEDGCIVIDLDCSSYPKTSPELEEALVEFHKDCASVYGSYENESQTVDVSTIYYVPEGYMLERDIPIWSIKEHGAEGSLDYVVKQWNNYIVKEHGVGSVTSADEMYNPDGSAIDWWLRMDIVYPSGNAAKDVPLLVNLSSNSPRMYSFRPGQREEVMYRNMFPMGFLTTGYAFATADHCYLPIARTETWGYFDNYTLEDYDGLASNTAFIRYLRMHLDEYNLSGKIGVMGISKASYGAVRLADPDNAHGTEYSLFEGGANTKEQPWAEGESHVDVAYAAAGNGTKRIPQYIDADCVPMVTSCGYSDSYNHWPKYPSVVKHMIDIDHIHLPLWMEDLGHTYPGMGKDVATGEERYVVFKRFFDHFLKPSEQTSADVFYIFPKEGSKTVDATGRSRTLPQDGLLPEMMGVPVDEPLTVRFLEEYTLEAVSSAVKIVSVEDGAEIEGEWTASMQNTNFSFTPAVLLETGKTYRITVPTSIASVSGASPSVEVIREFTVSQTVATIPDNVEAHKIAPIADSYATVAKNNYSKVRGAEPTMRIRYHTNGQWRYDAFLKFDLSEVDTTRMVRATVNLALASTLSETCVAEFYRTTTDWDEATMAVAAQNRPTIEQPCFAQATMTDESSWVQADITSIVRSCIEEGKSQIGIAVRMASSVPSSIEQFRFHSKEADKESVHPFMSVEKIKSHVGSPTIDVERNVAAGKSLKLSVAAEYEDEIESVAWYVDGELLTSDVVTFTAGEHKIKAVVSGPEEVGTDVIVKYVVAL